MVWISWARNECSQILVLLQHFGLIAGRPMLNPLHAWFPASILPLPLKMTEPAGARSQKVISSRVIISSFNFSGNGYHHIPFFLPCFDISVCLNNLIQRITPINDGFYRPCLDQFFEPEQVFGCIPCFPGDKLPTILLLLRLSLWHALR